MIKTAILALVYLSAPALIVPENVSNAQNQTKGISVIYKSNDIVENSADFASTNVADEENCDEVIVDFESQDDNGLHRYTMLRTE